MKPNYTLRELTEEIIRCIETGEDIDQYNRHGNTLLIESVIHLSICESANVAEKDIREKKYKLYKLITDLLENKANVNKANQDGFTPLRVAVEQNHQPLSHFLTINGADIHDPQLTDQYKNHPIIKNLRHAYPLPTEVSLIDYLAGDLLRFGKSTLAIQTVLGGAILVIRKLMNPDLDIVPDFFHQSCNTINSIPQIPKNFIINKAYQFLLYGVRQGLHRLVYGIFPENSSLKTPCKRLIDHLPTILLIQQVSSLAFQLYSIDYQNNLETGLVTPQQDNQNSSMKFLEQFGNLPKL